MEYNIQTYLEGNDGDIQELRVECTGDLNTLVKEFFDGTKRPRLWEVFADVLKSAKLQMDDWGK
jgi:hypothetical protein